MVYCVSLSLFPLRLVWRRLEFAFLCVGFGRRTFLLEKFYLKENFYMKKAKKFLVGLLAFASVSAFSLGVAACGEDGTDSGTLPPEGQNAIEQVYDSYVEYATAQGQTPLDYEAWLATIKGATGAQGIQGEQGVGIKTVYIENGHLFVILTEGDPIDCGPLPTDESNGSSNLSYIINEDGLGYTVTGIGLCSDREVVIPDANKGKPVTAIGDNAFNAEQSAGAGLITSIVIPDSVTTIGNGAFYECDSLTSVTIGNSVTTIGNGAFCYCDNLTSVTIGNSVTTINGAFYECHSLTEVYNKSSLNITAGNGEYGGVGYYATHVVTEENERGTFTTDDNGYIIYTNGDDKVLVGYTGEETDLTLPNDITQIKSYAFNRCTSLTSVTIGNSVTTIGDEAFYNCSSLTSVTIPDSVTTIGDYAFNSCSSLTSITIPDSVTMIGGRAFAYCFNLTSVTIPDSVTTIGDGAFFSCDNLTSVVFIDTSTWYIDIVYDDKVDCYQVDVSDAEDAADYLRNSYDYYWYKL